MDIRGNLVDLDWAPTIRSGVCDNSGGSCVDTAPLADGGVAVRNPAWPDVVTFTRADWDLFVAKAVAGELP